MSLTTAITTSSLRIFPVSRKTTSRSKSIARSFQLPVEIDQANAVAKYEDGVLKLTLPKKIAETRKLLAIH